MHDLAEVANTSLTGNHSESVWFDLCILCIVLPHYLKSTTCFCQCQEAPGMNLETAARDVTITCTRTGFCRLIFLTRIFPGNASRNAWISCYWVREDGSITGLCHRESRRQSHEWERKWFLKTLSVGRAMFGYILCMVSLMLRAHKLSVWIWIALKCAI